MHIPDGYLLTSFCIMFYLLAIPLWFMSIKKVIDIIKPEFIPIIAVGTAFTLTIMMFNLNTPGEMAGHAIGAAALSIICGPWISGLMITIALLIQTLFFGEGGITTFGANSLIIAYVTSFTAYYLYRFLSHKLTKFSSKVFAAGLSGYVSLSVGAMFTSILLGGQLLLQHSGSSIPTYFPYSIKIAVSIMLFKNLLLFSWLEAALTVIIIAIVLKDTSTISQFFKKDDIELLS